MKNTSMRDLLRRTAEAVARQKELPLSPGLLADGEPMLCAGAAVVYQAAARDYSSEALYQLALEMIGAGKEAILRNAAKLGLDTVLVELVVLSNDAYASNIRKPRMIEYLIEAAHRQPA